MYWVKMKRFVSWPQMQLGKYQLFKPNLELHVDKKKFWSQNVAFLVYFYVRVMYSCVKGALLPLDTTCKKLTLSDKKFPCIKFISKRVETNEKSIGI